MSKSTFSPTSLIGHKARFDALVHAFNEGRVPQTLLISGEPHLGKSTFGLRFAQLLLCQNPRLNEQNQPTSPCGQCSSCHQSAIGTHADFRVFRPLISAAEKQITEAPTDLISSVFSVSQAREFAGQAQSRALNGTRKVLMIHQVDRMNIAAQNALLKTFEEPAQGLCIVLLCGNADALLPTVRSRCWEVRLGLVSDQEIAQWLQEIEPDMDEKALQLALLAARGRPGIAWRESERSREEAQDSRLAILEKWVDEFAQASPVAALKYSQMTQDIALQWWQDDFALDGGKASALKGADSKVGRSAVALFLESLIAVYRGRWRNAVDSAQADSWAQGIDLMRETRRYVLRNANTCLALDVMFGRLLPLRQLH